MLYRVSFLGFWIQPTPEVRSVREKRAYLCTFLTLPAQLCSFNAGVHVDEMGDGYHDITKCRRSHCRPRVRCLSSLWWVGFRDPYVERRALGLATIRSDVGTILRISGREQEYARVSPD